MFRKAFILCVLAGSMLGLAACGPSAVQLTSAQAGKTVNVKVGQTFKITLAGNPTTGYTWETKDLDASLFQQIGEPAFASSNPGLAGAGGSLTLTFKALKAGTGTLTLVYHRPFEANVAPIDTYSVTISVH